MFVEARKQAKMSRQEAAHRLHVGERTLARYEKGESVPPPDVVRGMVRLYNRPEMTRKYCLRYCPLGAEWDKCCRALKSLGLFDKMKVVVERMGTEKEAATASR